VTPEGRAARDRIAAYLRARHANAGPVITHLWPRGPKSEPVDLLATDLQLVLAALDRYEAIAEFAGRHGPVPDRVEVTYSRAVRTPRGLDPPDGSGWDLPRDEPEDEGD